LLRSLRKGSTTIEYWHEFGADIVRAINTEIELKPDHAIFRVTLKPVDGNQRMDADRIFLNNLNALTKIKFSDSQIRKATARFLNAYKDRINHIKLEIIYKRSYEFNTSLKPTGKDGLSFELKA